MGSGSDKRRSEPHNELDTSTPKFSSVVPYASETQYLIKARHHPVPDKTPDSEEWESGTEDKRKRERERKGNGNGKPPAPPPKFKVNIGGGETETWRWTWTWDERGRTIPPSNTSIFVLFGDTISSSCLSWPWF